MFGFTSKKTTIGKQPLKTDYDNKIAAQEAQAQAIQKQLSKPPPAPAPKKFATSLTAE